MELVSNPVGASGGADEVRAIMSSDVGPDPRKICPAPVVPATPIASVPAMNRMQRHSRVARRGMERSRARDNDRDANPFLGLLIIYRYSSPWAKAKPSASWIPSGAKLQRNRAMSGWCPAENACELGDGCAGF